MYPDKLFFSFGSDSLILNQSFLLHFIVNLIIVTNYPRGSLQVFGVFSREQTH
jgi:hypothetical protein